MTEPQEKLKVELTIPEGMSDEQVIEITKELTSRLDDVHRALGGHGLQVESVEVKSKKGSEHE